MLKKNLVLIFILLVQLSVINVFADQVIVSKTKSTFVGKVYDRESNLPMPYAMIAVFDVANATLVTGGITSDDGTFSISGLEQGTYFIKVNFTGFKEFTINNIKVDGNKSEINLGNIHIAEERTEIQAVQVVADKQRVQYKVDKKVINVSQDINAVGGTAVDVLENTPSIQVDIDGNVTVRGSGNFTVLIDGRPTALEASDALQQIPASALENIEIITNPSAKYDPDGMGGVLNLITKKDALNGLDGIVNIMGATDESYRLDFTLNHRNSKRLFTFGLDTSRDWMRGNGDIARQTNYTDSTTFQAMDGDRNRYRGGYGLTLGTDLYLSPNTTLGFSAKAGTFKRGGTSDGFNMYKTEYKNAISPLEYWTKETENEESNNNYIALTSSIQTYFNKEKTHKLEGSLFYRYRNGDELDFQSEQYQTREGMLLDKYALQVRTSEEDTDNDIRANIDYTRPVGEDGKLEAGLQSRINSKTETRLFEDFNTEANAWINNEKFSNAMNFNRQIHSAYTTYSNKFRKAQYMLGLRGEYTYRVISDINDKESKINRFDWFPSAHVSYDISKNTQIMGSYSRRIDRPRGWDLNPYESYSNKTTIRKGNPDLAPEYTNSFDISMMQKFGKSFISIEAFQRSTKDIITRYSWLREEDGMLIQQTINAGDDKSLGGEVMLNVEATKWLTINASTSIYQYILSTSTNGVMIDKKSTNVDGNLNAIIKFNQNSRMQIMCTYRGPSVSAQGDREASIFSNISYKHEFMNKKLSATLSIKDIFGTAGWKGTNSGNGFAETFDFGPIPRVAQLTLSYKLNNYKEKKKSGNIDDGNEVDFGLN